MAEAGTGNTLRARPPNLPPFGAQNSAPEFPINFTSTQLPSPVTPNTQLVNSARFSSTVLSHPRSPCYKSPGITLSPAITAHDAFRLSLTAMSSPLRRASSSTASTLWTTATDAHSRPPHSTRSTAFTATTTYDGERIFVLVTADDGGDLVDMGVSRRDTVATRGLPKLPATNLPHSRLRSSRKSASWESCTACSLTFLVAAQREPYRRSTPALVADVPGPFRHADAPPAGRPFRPYASILRSKRKRFW
ncbi:hypothetical protein BD626DRAFT_575224 [Schizophyllum amplum]|uniref:Uncharacterized protein n=1 Tax=Schizophyllum amplum TaxID=97359 RepID=A0A550BW63_9AGAR|nr:hypothetical protein BD626DRAFT_575224 [Auriculariopsis ampla]